MELPLHHFVSLPHPISLLQHFFTSFGARDRCFLLLFRLWQNALLEKVGLEEAWTGDFGGGPGETMEPGVPELEDRPAPLQGHPPQHISSIPHGPHQGSPWALVTEAAH